MKLETDEVAGKKSLSTLVVLHLLVSSFGGLLVLACSTPAMAPAGDLIVMNSEYIIQDVDQPIDGNVEVGAGGTLVIRDATMSIISNNDPALKHKVSVYSGGKIVLDHGTITTYLDPIDPWPFLNITLLDGGQLIATNNSALTFPGEHHSEGRRVHELDGHSSSGAGPAACLGFCSSQRHDNLRFGQ